MRFMFPLIPVGGLTGWTIWAVASGESKVSEPLGFAAVGAMVTMSLALTIFSALSWNEEVKEHGKDR